MPHISLFGIQLTDEAWKNITALLAALLAALWAVVKKHRDRIEDKGKFESHDLRRQKYELAMAVGRYEDFLKRIYDRLGVLNDLKGNDAAQDAQLDKLMKMFPEGHPPDFLSEVRYTLHRAEEMQREILENEK